MSSAPGIAPSGSDAGFASHPLEAERARTSRVTDLFWLLYLYPLRLISLLLPPAGLYRIGKLAGPLVRFQSRKTRKRAARRILSVLPGATPAGAARIAEQCVSHEMRHKLDDLVLQGPARATLPQAATVDGIQHLDRALAAGKGVILLTTHFFGVRMAMAHLTKIGYAPLRVQNQGVRGASEGALQYGLRQRHRSVRSRGVGDVVYVQDPECGLKILQRLRSGGLVQMHIDSRHAKTTVEGRFFGVPRRFTAGVFDLVRLSGCAVIPTLCLGDGDGVDIRFDPILNVERADSREEFVNANLRAFTEVLERQVAAHPEQWRLWIWN